jgi:F0F1-type ATP synthase membrane subunit a
MHALMIVFLCVTNIHIVFALLSLSVADASFLTNCLTMVLFSTFINRVVEITLVERTNIQNMVLLSMATSVIPLLVCSVLLETVSIGFRSVSLGFRFLANIAAGHVLCDLGQGIKFHVMSYLHAFTQVTATTLSLLTIYELFVACIQIAVYVALIQVYAELS